MSPRIGLALAAALGAAAFSIASPARAQDSRVPASDWRQLDRSDAQNRYGSSQYFTFEARFGAYTPLIDSEFGGSGVGPYQRLFGTGLQFYFGFEIDVLPLRIPYVGAIGPGIGWGFTTVSAPAPFAYAPANADCTVDEPNPAHCSKGTTALTIMPMHVSIVLRVDELMRRTSIPVVPYGKFGIGLGYWRASTGDGVEQIKKDGKTIDAVGLVPGLHFAVGGMLALNFLDPQAASRLDEATGVNHIYVFGEWMRAKLDGLGSRPQLNVGTSTWVVGLAVDM